MSPTISTKLADLKSASKMDEATIQTEEQTEEPSLAEDGEVADNDESTVGTEEQERRERRRNKQRENKLKEKKRKEKEDDDDTYFSTSNETNKKEDSAITKAIDRFVDFLNPVEKDLDNEDDTLVSEATDGTTPAISKESKQPSQPKPSLMQQLDKHVLTRFGCSSNPAYIPEDEAVEHPIDRSEPTTEVQGTDEIDVPGGDASAYGVNSILHVDDPGDPDIQLKSLDEDNSSDGSNDGARAFFCGAVPLKGERGDKNVMSEIAEEKKMDDEQSKGIIHSPSQLEDLPFDQQPPKPAEAEPEAPAMPGVFGSMLANLNNIKSKVFPQEGGNESPSKPNDMKEGTPAAESSERALVEGEAIFEEAAMDGHEVPPKDVDERSEEGEEVPAIPEEFERKQSEMPFDEPANSAEETDDEDDAEVEEEKAPEEESPKEKEESKEEPPEEAPKEVVKAPAAVPVPVPAKPAPQATTTKSSKASSTKQSKDKKKKTGLFGKIFKKKSKKDKATKESILEYDENKDVSPSEALIIPEEPPAKETRPTAPVDPTVTNQSKRESWKNKEPSSKQELNAGQIKKTNSADFDVLLTKTVSSKNAANADWEKLTGPSTPTKPRPAGSSSSPSGVADFPDPERIEL